MALQKRKMNSASSSDLDELASYSTREPAALHWQLPLRTSANRTTSPSSPSRQLQWKCSMRKTIPLFLLFPWHLAAQSALSIAPDQCVWNQGDDARWAAPDFND